MARVPSLGPRPEIIATQPAYHGAFDYAELEQLVLNPDELLDFSVNSNPYGPSPQVQAALAAVPLDRYPDRESLRLRRKLAEHLDISPARILVGNGGAELLWLICFTFLERGERVLIIGPTFGEYSRSAALMGAHIETWTAPAADDFSIEAEALARQLQDLKPTLLFLCNPNNPTGQYLRPELIGDWARARPRTLFVIDEAYLAFVARARSTLTLGLDNILVVRSMTKDYALAGLRLGYVAGQNRALIDALGQARPAWNVNGLAQAAGLAALADQSYLQRSLTALARANKELRAGLEALDLAPLPSATHFFLMEVGNGAAFRQVLLRQHLLVRDCASFGLPQYVRIASRRPEENTRLVATIQSLAGEEEGK
jgi:histidinol-phosphate aminotransferase